MVISSVISQPGAAGLGEKLVEMLQNVEILIWEPQPAAAFDKVSF